MRDIKFRSWDGRRISTMYMTFNTSTGTLEVPTQQSLTGKPLDTPIVIMQFTGLTDKNGVEIYEGDIVNMVYDEPYDRPHIVVYLEKSAKWIAIHVIEHEAFKSGMREIYFANTGKVPNSFNATVIGNIHSTPELLTPKQ